MLRLQAAGHETLGIDNLDFYYDPALKLARLESQGLKGEKDFRPYTAIVGAGSLAGQHVTLPLPEWGKEYPLAAPDCRFMRADICDRQTIGSIFAGFRPEAVVNLAAQAGARDSVAHPRPYIDTNVAGFTNMLECARRYPVSRFLYASSSSVYGAGRDIPSREDHITDRPVSVYAATKRCGELLAGVYRDLYGVPATGLRFFTVYGPWGRPDMAPLLFADSIMSGRTVNLFNGGKMRRDFTYIDDVVEGIMRVLTEESATGVVRPIYNIGSGDPVDITEFLEILEEKLHRKALRREMPMQPGDVPATYADTSALEQDFGFTPCCSLRDGLEKLADWYVTRHARVSNKAESQN